MAYDRADNGPINDAVRIAFFVTWAMLNGRSGQVHQEESLESLHQLRQREIMPRKFLEIACDDKFWEEDLSDAGNLFARIYYPYRHGLLNYFDDYKWVFAEHIDLSLVTDTWENYDKIAPIIGRRYEEWQKTVSEKT